MIIVAGDPFDISTIMIEYPENSIERQLLDKMSESTVEYNYDSLNQLKFELRLRKEIVNTAKQLHNSRFSFEIFHKSKCNLDFWDRTDNGGFKLKDGVKPSDAINDIFINSDQYATECATAMVIIYYKSLLNIFGDDHFNELFPNIFLMNWYVIEPLLQDVGTPKPVEEMLLGDRGYFMNPDVDPKTPEWQGENVIVLPDELYYGHGIGIETSEDMINILNSNRKEDATQSAYFLDSAGRPNFKKLSDTYDRVTSQAATPVWSVFPRFKNINGESVLLFPV